MLAHLLRLPDRDEAWLFPADKDPSKPVDVWAISTIFRRAYALAGLETLKGGLWHPWRRKWATERKGMPLRDVAVAGGWRDPTTLLKCYQQPDEDTIQRVVLEAPKFRAKPIEVTPEVTPGAGDTSQEGRRKAG